MGQYAKYNGAVTKIEVVWIKLVSQRIDTLESKIRKEKQLNRQMEMNAELKKLRKEWRNLL